MAEAVLKAWSAFLGTHARALRRVEARLKAAGMPPLEWYDVLLELERAGGRLRIGDLAERVVVAPYNMTRLLDRLEADGLLGRERLATDRRGAFAVLTAKGGRLRKEMWPVYEAAIRDVFAPLTASEAQTLERGLDRVAARLRAADRDGPEAAAAD
ncbi:MAG: MarR family transcriptional regulator [Bauldia sp.]|nr:MarR family transcriptional regulator [Bauldia sp.]